MTRLSLPSKKPPEPVPQQQADPCVEFLRSFLNDGPRMRTYVYREAEDRHIPWEDVKNTFAELRGQEYVVKGQYFWRLIPD